MPVDPLSLSSLMSQGFDESRARRALRVNKNDTQAALEWLVNGDEGHSDPKPDQVSRERRNAIVVRTLRNAIVVRARSCRTCCLI